VSINNISIINNAYSALEIAQAGMTITSQNVSGANVEGFSRRRANNVVGLMAPNSRDFGSTAFAVEGFTRFIDNLLTKQMLDQKSKSSYTNTLLQSVAGLDSVIIDPSMSIATAVSKFMNAAGTLANDDQNLTNKQNFAGAATQLATRISSFNEYLNDIKRSTQTNMSGILNESNSLSTALRGINQKILASSSPGYSTPSADLLDERDRITMRLQDLLGGSTIINEDGTATFQIGGVSLVDRMSANQFVNTDIGVSDGAIFNVFMKSEQTGTLVGPLSTNVASNLANPNVPTQIKSIFTSGQAGAAFEILAKFIPNLQREVSALTLGIFRDVNSVKKQDGNTEISAVFGYRASGGGFNTDIPGILSQKWAQDSNGNLLTEGGKYYEDANDGRLLKIEEIMAASDPSSNLYNASIAAAVNDAIPDKNYGVSSFVSILSYGPEISLNFTVDATAANNIQQLRSSFSNPLSTITNDVAATISSWKNTDKVNQVVAKQLSDRRESISGINLDEEAANLVKFQQMYGAASKVMQSANQMFNLLLNMLSE
jgi:flagellar hook-associated protein 1 FlgK